MATNYKNIVITPNIGSSTDDPTIRFSGGNTTVNTDITLKVYPTSNGTLSFEGSAGQLFSITNDLTGSIFSVNDVSGIPSIDVNADGTVDLAPYGGTVGIGTTSPSTAFRLDVQTNTNLGTSSDNNGVNFKSANRNSFITLDGGLQWTEIIYFANSGVNKGSIVYSNPTNSMAFTTDGTESMRIAASGNVLIGRTTSTVGAGVKLDVAGAANASNILVNGNMALTTQNYNSYAPTLTGTGASGTWGINVTGSAGSATTATNSTQLGGVAAANFVQGDGARGRSVSRTGGTANSLTDPSGFYFGNSVTGMPTTDWWTWNQSIGNSWVSPDGYGWQHAVSFWSDDIRIRRLQSGAWQPWTVMLHSGNYNSYSPTLTGTGASGTWSINVTGSAGSATTASQLGGVAASSYMRTDSGQTVSARHTFTSSQTATLQNASGSLGGLEVYSAGASAAAFMCFHRPGAYASYFGIDTDNNFAVGGWSAGSALGLMKVGSFGVGTAASGTAGEIRATNNITAYYSDKRLKTNIKQIENALDKVNKISGVTFQSNEEAAKYGYTDKKTQVGVIAQEIEAVLPEVVVPAPFDIDKDKDGNEYSKSGQDYKTVQYEKLVPLLIEAIKELSGQVTDLQNQIQELKK